MTMYAGACQDLGFRCDWQVQADSRRLAVSGLLEHVNQAHGTGTASPALATLIDRHVIDLPAGGTGTHSSLQEHAS